MVGGGRSGARRAGVKAADGEPLAAHSMCCRCVGEFEEFAHFPLEFAISRAHAVRHRIVAAPGAMRHLQPGLVPATVVGASLVGRRWALHEGSVGSGDGSGRCRGGAC